MDEHDDPATARARVLRAEGLSPSEIAARLTEDGVRRDGRPHTWMRTDVVHMLGLPLSRSLPDDEFVPADPAPPSAVAGNPGPVAAVAASAPRMADPVATATSLALKVLAVVGLCIALVQGDGDGMSLYTGAFAFLVAWGLAVSLDLLVRIDQRSR